MPIGHEIGTESALLASSSFSSSIVVLVTYVSVVAIFRGVAEIAAAFSVRQLTSAAA